MSLRRLVVTERRETELKYIVSSNQWDYIPLLPSLFFCLPPSCLDFYIHLPEKEIQAQRITSITHWCGVELGVSYRLGQWWHP